MDKKSVLCQKHRRVKTKHKALLETCKSEAERREKHCWCPYQLQPLKQHLSLSTGKPSTVGPLSFSPSAYLCFLEPVFKSLLVACPIERESERDSWKPSVDTNLKSIEDTAQDNRETEWNEEKRKVKSSNSQWNRAQIIGRNLTHCPLHRNDEEIIKLSTRG